MSWGWLLRHNIHVLAKKEGNGKKKGERGQKKGRGEEKRRGREENILKGAGEGFQQYYVSKRYAGEGKRTYFQKVLGKVFNNSIS